MQANDVIDAVEIDLSIAMGWRGSYAPVAGRRRLLDELISAAVAFERALLDLDATSWGELVRDVDREKADLPFGFQRGMMDAAHRLGKAEALADMLAERGTRPPPIVPAALTEIARAARGQRARLGLVETRGKRREDARDNAIKRLAEVFHNSAKGERDYRGRLIDFVSAALKAARLPAPESEENVWALVPKPLRSPRTGPRPTAPHDNTLAELVAEHKTLREKRTRRGPAAGDSVSRKE